MDPIRGGQDLALCLEPGNQVSADPALVLLHDLIGAARDRELKMQESLLLPGLGRYLWGIHTEMSGLPGLEATPRAIFPRRASYFRAACTRIPAWPRPAVGA